MINSPRAIFALIALFCLFMMATALYMQHVLGLTPCYLCITQRVFVIAIGITTLIAAIHTPGLTGRRIYAAITGILAMAGGFFSSKQLWLQSLPEDKVPACGPPAEYLFQAFNFNEALSMLLRGDGNCAKVQWTMLGMSIPAWTLMAFIAILITCCWLACKKN